MSCEWYHGVSINLLAGLEMYMVSIAGNIAVSLELFLKRSFIADLHPCFKLTGFNVKTSQVFFDESIVYVDAN